MFFFLLYLYIYKKIHSYIKDQNIKKEEVDYESSFLSTSGEEEKEVSKEISKDNENAVLSNKGTNHEDSRDSFDFSGIHIT